MRSMAAELAGPPPQADEHLVTAARDGDREAFAVLVHRYRGVAQAYAFAILRDRDDAEDAAQEAFARAYTGLARLRRGVVWQPWLMTIVRNCCRDALRRRRVRRTEPIDVAWLEGCASPEADFLSDERLHELHAAVAALPESLRVPLVMHFLSRCTYREIALALGVPETTIVGRIARAVRVLRQRLVELDR
jgi:RNA polymerase sigma-70 factor (ECF subfamily)